MLRRTIAAAAILTMWTVPACEQLSRLTGKRDPAAQGCASDKDCKGDRICNAGQCIDAAATATTATTASAAAAASTGAAHATATVDAGALQPPAAQPAIGAHPSGGSVSCTGSHKMLACNGATPYCCWHAGGDVECVAQKTACCPQAGTPGDRCGQFKENYFLECDDSGDCGGGVCCGYANASGTYCDRDPAAVQAGKCPSQGQLTYDIRACVTGSDCPAGAVCSSRGRDLMGANHCSVRLAPCGGGKCPASETCCWRPKRHEQICTPDAQCVFDANKSRDDVRMFCRSSADCDGLYCCSFPTQTAACADDRAHLSGADGRHCGYGALCATDYECPWSISQMPGDKLFGCRATKDTAMWAPPGVKECVYGKPCKNDKDCAKDQHCQKGRSGLGCVKRDIR